MEREKIKSALSLYLINLPRRVKRAVIIATDLSLMYLALWSALYLRLSEFYIPPTPILTAIYVSAPIISVLVFYRMKVYRQVTRYLDQSFVARIIFSSGLSVLIWALVILLCGAVEVSRSVIIVEVPRSVIIMYGVLMVLFIWMCRELARWVLKDAPLPREHKARIAPTKNVLIYGAGPAGVQLLNELKGYASYNPVAFVDTNNDVLGQRVGGLKVYAPDRIGRFITQDHVQEIFIAVPEASWTQKREIIRSLEKYKVIVKALPAMGDIASGRVEVSDLKPLDVLDLLGRAPVPPIPELLDRNIRGKAVMVTGAGGSIGSEISRQILRQNPETLVLFEVSESALYEIEQELRETQIKLNNADLESTEPLKCGTIIIPILGSVLDARLLETTLNNFRVQTIYHAAAYKHVPLVEQNPFTGLKNNTFGTLTIAKIARKLGVERFVLVSTDKAVRPTNIMGASKRLAELVLQSFADQTHSTVFTMVRFGNVLDSSGSVIRCFRKQIGNGGPVTVTHPNINRFFMSIPEAAELVIQAGALAEGGDVFVLDMGEPIKIDDLARSLIRLVGLEVKSNDNPEGDIAIEYIGLRPGEKLYEELLIGENTTGTAHARIMKHKEPFIPAPELEMVLKKLAKAIDGKDLESIVSILHQTVEGYQPPEAQNVDNLHSDARDWTPSLQTIH